MPALDTEPSGPALDTEALARTELDSPLGELVMVHRGAVLCALAFADRLADLPDARRELVRAARGTTGTDGGRALTERLRAYFDGDLSAIEDIDVQPDGTPFQMAVWRRLRQIPAGTTATYSDIADALERPGAERAVGAANGRNPIAIVVPCHRVIGADGSLTGYSGGIERKRWLLEHEGWSGTQHALFP